jgi:hypothetical protein
MKIIIPEGLYKNFDQIDQLWVEIFDGNKRSNFTVYKEHVKDSEYIEIPNNIFFNAVSLGYKVLYKFGSTDRFFYENKNTLIYRGLSDAGVKCVRQNNKTSYSNNTEGAFKCLKDLDEKIFNNQTLSPNTIGKKNLLYYTVYFNTGYVDLLELSLETILNNSKKLKFDVLIITDEPTLNLIKNTKIWQKIKFKVLITPTPYDGVEASKNKLKLFDFEDINSYQKILFLDCDVVAVGDVNQIFDQELKSDYFYTARNLNIDEGFFTTIHHGFECLSKEFVREMRSAGQMPFNAGQFLFLNSQRMKGHFENINWFMKNWSLEYFFEQVFMCYYFAKAYMIEKDFLQKHASIVSTQCKTLLYKITSDTILIHFIAPALNANKKIPFIKKFILDHQPSKKSFSFRDIFKKFNFNHK